MRVSGKFLPAACMAMVLAASPALAQKVGHGMMDGGDQSKGMMSRDGKDGGKGMMGCPMMGKGMMDKGMMHSRPMMEARLAFIKADLDITEEQTNAWNAYADAVRARHAAMEDMRKPMMKAKESGNAVERMDAHIEATEAKLKNLKTLKPKVEALYDVLTDDQKKKADKLLGSVCGKM